MNPLLDFTGLPRFAEIEPEHVTPAVEELLDRNRALTASLLVETEPPTWRISYNPSRMPTNNWRVFGGRSDISIW
jgi:Zn-dependent oligopeptidase